MSTNPQTSVVLRLPAATYRMVIRAFVVGCILTYGICKLYFSDDADTAKAPATEKQQPTPATEQLKPADQGRYIIIEVPQSPAITGQSAVPVRNINTEAAIRKQHTARQKKIAVLVGQIETIMNGGSITWMSAPRLIKKIARKKCRLTINKNTSVPGPPRADKTVLAKPPASPQVTILVNQQTNNYVQVNQ